MSKRTTTKRRTTARRKPASRIEPDTAKQIAVALAGNSSIPLLVGAGIYTLARKAQGKPLFGEKPSMLPVPDVPDPTAAFASFAAADAERDAERERRFFNFFGRERDRETRERQEQQAEDLLVKNPVDVKPTGLLEQPRGAAGEVVGARSPFVPYVATRGEPVHSGSWLMNADRSSIGGSALDRGVAGDAGRPVFRDGRLLAPGLGGMQTADFGDADARESPFEWPAEYPGATKPAGTWASGSGEAVRRGIATVGKFGAGFIVGGMEAVPDAFGKAGEFVGGFLGQHEKGEQVGDFFERIEFPESEDPAFEVGRNTPAGFLKWLS